MFIYGWAYIIRNCESVSKLVSVKVNWVTDPVGRKCQETFGTYTGSVIKTSRKDCW